MNTLDYLKDKYNTRLLTLDQVGAEIGMKRLSINTAICTGRFPMPTMKIGQKRYVKIEWLAEYMDKLGDEAEREFKESPAEKKES